MSFRGILCCFQLVCAAFNRHLASILIKNGRSAASAVALPFLIKIAVRNSEVVNIEDEVRRGRSCGASFSILIIAVWRLKTTACTQYKGAAIAKGAADVDRERSEGIRHRIFIFPLKNNKYFKIKIL